MTDIDRVRQLIEMMTEHELTELSVKSGEEEIYLKRPGKNEPAFVAPPQLTAPLIAQEIPALPDAPAAAEPASPDDGLIKVVSPMVGTFYTASAPDAEPFVKEGQEVRPDSVVCVIEAMKVFNEIRAEVAGIIRKIYVKNEQMVDFGKELFAIQAI